MNQSSERTDWERTVYGKKRSAKVDWQRFEMKRK